MISSLACTEWIRAIVCASWRLQFTVSTVSLMTMVGLDDFWVYRVAIEKIKRKYAHSSFSRLPFGKVSRFTVFRRKKKVKRQIRSYAMSPLRNRRMCDSKTQLTLSSFWWRYLCDEWRNERGGCDTCDRRCAHKQQEQQFSGRCCCPLLLLVVFVVFTVAHH